MSITRFLLVVIISTILKIMGHKDVIKYTYCTIDLSIYYFNLWPQLPC